MVDSLLIGRWLGPPIQLQRLACCSSVASSFVCVRLADLVATILTQYSKRDMSKFGRRIKQAPEGYDYVEPTITALENELRESKYIALVFDDRGC